MGFFPFFKFWEKLKMLPEAAECRQGALFVAPLPDNRPAIILSHTIPVILAF